MTIVVIMTTISGCSGKGIRSESETEAGTKIPLVKGDAQNSKKVNPDFSKRIKISYDRIDSDKAGKDPLYELISKKFNVDIQFIPVTWDNWIEKTNIFIASGDLPDILWWDLRAPQYAKFAEWCRNGVFKEIPDLGEKFPNLEKVLKLMPVTEKFKVDKKTYMIPHYTDQSEMKGMDGVQYYYRKDWATKVGIDKDVFTYEDFKNYVKVCIAKDPGGNGSGETLGVVGPTWMVPDHVFMLEANPDFASYVKRNGKYVWGAALPETLEGIKISKELYNEGIINKNFYTVNDLDGETQFLNGKAAVLVGSIDAGQLRGIRDHFKANNPQIDDGSAVMPMKVLGPHGKTLVTEDYGFWSASSFNPKIEDEKLERILYLMDWCCTDEAGELYNYGIRGKDWDMVDGKFMQLWQKDLNGVFKKPVYMDFAYVYFTFGTNGGQFGFKKNLTFDEKLRKDTIDWVVWRQSVPQSVQKVDSDLDFLDTLAKSKYGSYYYEVKNEIKKLIIGSNDVDKDWNAWLKSMEGKVNPILEEINNALVK